MVTFEKSFIGAGGNRHPAASDWHQDSGLLAFGSGRNVALWYPKDEKAHGITQLLVGHQDDVNVVKFFPGSFGRRPVIISGSVDKTIRIWCPESKEFHESPHFVQVDKIESHSASVNAICCLNGTNLVVSGSSDGELKIWSLDISEKNVASHKWKENISLCRPKFIPLAIAAIRLSPSIDLIAVAGTFNKVLIFTRPKGLDGSMGMFRQVASLPGHEGWIRSLDITQETPEDGSDFLLASASQDKYIRLWRIHRGADLPAAAATDPSLGSFGLALSNKAYRFNSGEETHSITFEALLVGHEDWIYTARWMRLNAHGYRLQLLSASADNSLAVWEKDDVSLIWVVTSRLGEISAQKGSTTATGSTGGFWSGLWFYSGILASVSAAGSWRVWEWDPSVGDYLQQIGVGGHTKEVRGISWSKDGSYLLSTSADQTTRLYAEWKRDGRRSWHEFARPQIHGYDLNCIASLNPSRFISGADEKLMRVFDEPASIATLLSGLCEIATPGAASLPETATMPVLGLSNKAVDAADPDSEGNTQTYKSALEALTHPPLEDQLSRLTLFPEIEKLYGHGAEISALAASQSGNLIASACRASSEEHAVIRMYRSSDWREVKPPLQGHSHTVLGLSFSADDEFLLSVGRDRTWILWRKEEGDDYVLWAKNPSAHTRMILSCAWVPPRSTTDSRRIFVTAGRDKKIRAWAIETDVNKPSDDKTNARERVTLFATVDADGPITAVSVAPSPVDGSWLVVYGNENGRLSGALISVDGSVSPWDEGHSPIVSSGEIHGLEWRVPLQQSDEKLGNGRTLAVAADDGVLVYDMWL
ncbi:WD40 repeat-like protein [Eremomyces bilateralis CBS 781.70]|uniref:Elongator complex protein 2 n=1 Tax=Eremomyces bilateralis CBS 781.70 TaxID=1392243 RepID=A0A6G1FRI1_9PEZI|nr:WD40 repeat-like protein [Eremomyces bilateralis CBS 781.70]KAF1808289.1 WD40 repeat-like protein [Eremomyces bilateralis CBS 781.70]